MEERDRQTDRARARAQSYGGNAAQRPLEWRQKHQKRADKAKMQTKMAAKAVATLAPRPSVPLQMPARRRS